jgi:hypothetical protein
VAKKGERPDNSESFREPLSSGSATAVREMTKRRELQHLTGLQRQSNSEDRADAGRAFHFDRTAVILDDFFRDVEAQAGAALGLFRRKVRIEDSVYLRWLNTCAGVLDSKIDIKILLRTADADNSFFAGAGLDRV